MNNRQNKKLLGMELLRKTQILSQSNAITTKERLAIASSISEGMATGTFSRLKDILFEILPTTELPEIVEEMILSI